MSYAKSPSSDTDSPGTGYARSPATGYHKSVGVAYTSLPGGTFDTPPPVDDDFWTVLTPSGDSRVIYVSASGSNSNDGLSEGAPKQTYAAAYALQRDGFPDWILFKRGETFSVALDPFKSGRSAEEPMVYGAYGVGNRPVFQAGTGDGLDVSGGSSVKTHLRFVSLVFYAHRRDPDNLAFNLTTPTSGLHWRSPTDDVIFEDCDWNFFGGSSVQDSSLVGISGMEFRRCKFINSYSPESSGHSEGMYMDGVDGCLYDSCIFYHNGWNDNVAGANKNQFNHGLYVDNGNSQTAIEIRNCFFLSNSSHGAQLRPGGKLNGNHAEYNANALLFGGGDAPNVGGVYGEDKDNVVIHGTDIPTISPGQRGISLQNIRTTAASVVCSGNVVANAQDNTANESIDLGVTGVSYSANVIYNWPVGTSLGSYVDHARDLAKYFSTLPGGSNSYPAAVAAILAQRKPDDGNPDTWNPALEASAVNTYVQAGFVAA